MKAVVRHALSFFEVLSLLCPNLCQWTRETDPLAEVGMSWAVFCNFLGERNSQNNCNSP
jgi:hypothetical protein